MSDNINQPGLAEAIRIIMDIDPESDEILHDCIDSYQIADTGDYGCNWNIKKLEKKFGLNGSIENSPKNKMLSTIEGMYWEQVGEKHDIKFFAKMVGNLLDQISREKVDKSDTSDFHHLHGWVERYSNC